MMVRICYGVPIGILAGQTDFPRTPGDQGNATTYSFPVNYRTVEGFTYDGVVVKDDPTLMVAFIKTAKELEEEGVKAVTTTCGFLSMWQKEISDAVNIPIFTSSLLLVPLVSRMLKRGRKIGIITANASTLKEKHLRGAGIDSSIPLAIAGMENEEWWSKIWIKGIRNEKKIESEVVRISKQLVLENPDTGAIVLECANLPPYACAVQQATGLPVFDITTLTNMVFHALVRERFAGFM